MSLSTSLLGKTGGLSGLRPSRGNKSFMNKTTNFRVQKGY